MRRGTTPTIQINIAGLENIKVDVAYLTIKQLGTAIEKTGDDIAIDGDTITATLTQEETLQLAAGADTAIQLRVLSEGGTAYASNIAKVKVGAILKEGVIPSG